MPGGTGIELAEKVFKHKGRKPFVYLMTGYSDLTLEEAHKLGVKKIMSKPFEPKELIKDIVAILGKSD
jgi:CheY-like chemotaxis protein